jgi:hypothetical protein
MAAPNAALDALQKRADEWLARTDPADPHNCDEIRPLAADVLALLAVVETLPRCEYQVAGCAAIGTKRMAGARTDVVCDGHARHDDPDLPYATALRALLTRSG